MWKYGNVKIWIVKSYLVVRLTNYFFTTKQKHIKSFISTFSYYHISTFAFSLYLKSLHFTFRYSTIVIFCNYLPVIGLAGLKVGKVVGKRS